MGKEGMEMDTAALKSMRMKQVVIVNALLIFFLLSYFLVINHFAIKSSHLFIFLGMVILVQAVYGLLKGDSTKSLIPFYEKVAIYEREKMGNEWGKQRKVSNYWNLVLSGLFFLNAYLTRGSSSIVVEADYKFMSILGLFLLIMVNIASIVHFRKVDTSTTKIDFKGYTWKSNLIAVVVGIIFAIIMIVVVFTYISTTV